MSLRRRDEELIVRRLDGRASPAELEELERRLHEDTVVRRHFEEARRLIDGLGKLEAPEPPFDLVAMAQRRAQLEATAPRRFSFLWSLVPAAAVALLVLMLRPQERTPEAPELALRADHVVGSAWVEDAAGRRAITEGAVVTAGARLESAAGSSLTLRHGKSAALTLHEGSALRVVRHAATTELELQHGVVRADSGDALLAFEVRAVGVAQVVRVAGGSAGVLTDGKGSMTVSVLAGVTRLRGERELEVPSGFTVSAGPEGVGEPRASGSELALELQTVGAIPPGVRQVELVGRTAPGVLLEIDGVPVEVAADGSFRHLSSFDGQPRRLVVRVRDALDRHSERVVALAPAPAKPSEKAPQLRPIETEWEWEEPGKTPG